MFWNLVEAEFSHTDWRVRFGGVEKVTVLLRELDSVVVTGGFSGAAGVKVANLLSGGSIGGCSGVNLFGRPTTPGPSRPRGGRVNLGKSNIGLSRSHPSNMSTADRSGPTASFGASNDNPIVRTALAHVICSLIGSLNDVTSMVAEYTAIQLASLNNTSLQVGT